MSALAQGLVVALIVGACTAFAVWKLMPSAARRWIATAALRWPLPAVVSSPLRRAAQARSGGCACDGCDLGAPKPPATTTQPLVFHPRPRR